MEKDSGTETSTFFHSSGAYFPLTETSTCSEFLEQRHQNLCLFGIIFSNNDFYLLGLLSDGIIKILYV